MTQPSLFTVSPLPQFHGPDVTHEDRLRLANQLRLVMQAMADGQWRTLRRISQMTGASEPSASARLRDLRRPENGGFLVERRRVAGQKGLFEYRVVGVKGATA